MIATDFSGFHSIECPAGASPTGAPITNFISKTHDAQIILQKSVNAKTSTKLINRFFRKECQELQTMYFSTITFLSTNSTSFRYLKNYLNGYSVGKVELCYRPRKRGGRSAGEVPQEQRNRPFLLRMSGFQGECL